MTGGGARPGGQVLVLFMFALTTLLIAGALALDGSMLLLHRRDQQNGGDAAAIAGARFLPGDTAGAVAAAQGIATSNGFTSGMDGATVTVNTPPLAGIFAGQAGFIEVEISVQYPVLLAGVMGRGSWTVTTRSVAANQTLAGGGLGVLALDPAACPAFSLSGDGTLHLDGNLQVNSSCTSGDRAARAGGTGTVIVGTDVSCNVVGGWSQGGSVTNDCPVLEGATTVPDPYAGLPEPTIPTSGDPPVIVYPAAPVQVSGTVMAVPSGCPGSATPASDLVPLSCRFTSAYADTSWRLSPGYYPGGINLEAGTFYLQPGIYHVAGGFDPGSGLGPVSFRAAGSSISLISVDAGTTTYGGGILIFNDHHATLQDGSVALQGGSSQFKLLPLSQGTPWDGMVIFQSAEVTRTVTLAGGSSSMQVRGTIYVPGGTISASADSNLTVDQLIANKVLISGTGAVTIAFDANYLSSTPIAGLVE